MAATSEALPLPSARLVSLGGRLIIIVLAVGALPIAYQQPMWVFTAVAGLATLVAMTVDRTLVIPIVIVAMPLEVSKDYLPSVFDDPSTPTIQESIFDAGRLAMLAAAALWVARARSGWQRDVPQSALYFPLALLAAVFVISGVYAEESSGALRDIFRLLSGIGIFAIVILYVRDRKCLDRALLALLASGLALALVGLFQQATDTYFLNERLASLHIPRRNATFFDPNIYARFLVVVIVVAVGVAASGRGQPWQRYLAPAAAALALLVLPFTSSRSNWATLVVVLPLVIAMLPMAAWRKFKLLALFGAAGGVLALAASIADPALIDRFESIVSGKQSLGSRTYLIKAGWQMFKDHPLFGVGLNGYREALQGQYSDFLPRLATNFLSHSTLITIMAELGIIGLSVVAFVGYRFLHICWRLYVEAGRGDRALVAGLTGAALAVFVSSQSEARLIEDPYLWIVLGLVVALGAILRQERADLPPER